MGDKTGIEWSQASWNAITGCSRASSECVCCYAQGVAARLEKMGVKQYAGVTSIVNGRPTFNGKINFVESALYLPLRWTRPRKIFVNSMSDLFHEHVSQEWVDRIFAVMALAQTKGHTFQSLTKRADRQQKYLSDPELPKRIARAIDLIPAANQPSAAVSRRIRGEIEAMERLVLPNLWVGVSAGNQEAAVLRVPDLLATPAAVRWVSVEPMIGPVDLKNLNLEQGYFRQIDALNGKGYGRITRDVKSIAKLDWVVVGGESGDGARPMSAAWAQKLRDQCQFSSVPFFFKQWGAWAPREVAMSVFGKDYDPGNTVEMAKVGKRDVGRLLDGKLWDEYPVAAK